MNLVRQAQARKILEVDQLNLDCLLVLIRAGKELARCGHTFTVLLSDQDTVSRAGVNTKVITFPGPAGFGSKDWAADLSRDPQVVSTTHFS